MTKKNQNQNQNQNQNRGTGRRHQVGERQLRLLRLDAVMEMTGLSRSVIYLLMDEGKFPRPLLVSRRSVRWVESEVIDFILSRPRAGSERRRG